MSIGIDERSQNAYGRFRETAAAFFGAQLEHLGLSRSKIATQEIVELQDSLARVDDALRSPESFGVLKLKVTADAGAMIVKANSEAHVEIGVVPHLLECKKDIIDRLRHLQASRPVKTIEELIDSLSDSGLRDQLRTELQATRRSASPQASSRKVCPNRAFIAMAMDPQDPDCRGPSHCTN